MNRGPKGKVGYVYFMGSGDYIKIGFATHVGSRLASIQSSNPESVSLYKFFPTEAPGEFMVHDHFAERRYRGEWFHDHEAIEDFWDDIYDFQFCSLLYRDASKEVLQNGVSQVFIDLVDLRFLLDNAGKDWDFPVRERAL